MKKLFLLLAFGFGIVGYSQEIIKTSEVVTSEEEYVFLTETLAKSDNAKMLPGYELVDFMNVPDDGFNFEYKLFVHTETKEKRAILIIATKIKKKEDKVKYLCFPLNNPELLTERYLYDRATIGISMVGANDDNLFILLSKLLDNKFNVNK